MDTAYKVLLDAALSPLSSRLRRCKSNLETRIEELKNHLCSTSAAHTANEQRELCDTSEPDRQHDRNSSVIVAARDRYGDDIVLTDDDTVQTDDDAVQTDDNAVQTDDDTVQTDDDAVQTDDDTVQTDDNAVQTDDDTVQTDDDCVQSNSTDNDCM